MAKASKIKELSESDAFKGLMQAGLELGIAEAMRRLASFIPAGSEKGRRAEIQALLGGAVIAEVVQAVRNDPNSVFQLVKEVWSRGGPKEREAAARAVGRGLGKIAPHQAVGLTRELAAMSRDRKDADLIGREAIEPLLENAPSLLDRVKLLLQDNERWVRRAAIAGLVAYVGRRKKMAGVALEAILLVAVHNEQEIRQGVKWAVKEIGKVDWKATGKAIADWAALDKDVRAKQAKDLLTSTAGAAKKNISAFVTERVARFGEGKNGAKGAKPARR